MFKITYLSQSVWNFIRTEHLKKYVQASMFQNISVYLLCLPNLET